MIKGEFRKQVEAFWTWAADRDRDPEFWWLALEDYAKQEYERCYRERAAAPGRDIPVT